MMKNHSEVHSETHARCQISIVLDPEPSDPREDGDNNFGTMVCWHRSYELGDEQPKNQDPEEYLLELARSAVSFNYPEALLEKNRDAILRAHYAMLPLYLYDHSGITMRTAAFSCPWDSGQVGFIFCSLDKAKESQMLKSATWNTPVKWQKEAQDKPGTVSLREYAENVMRGEVSAYDQYLTGMVYGFEVEHENGETDSCWGFYQEENPGAKDSYVLSEAREAAETLDKKAKREEIEAKEWEARGMVTVAA